MKKMNNPLKRNWFIDNNKLYYNPATILYTTENKKEVTVIKNIIYNIKNYNENGICECGQSLDQTWEYCPKCGNKIIWK